MIARRFVPSQLEGVEDVEDYQPGGFHPVSLGDHFGQNRYRVVHKLGFGGSSTVWLARDKRASERLVTLKILRASASSGNVNEFPALTIPKMLQANIPPSVGIQVVDDHFHVQGVNGSHLCLVSPFAGPSVLAMSDCPGRTLGSRRLRAALARDVSRQVATAVCYMHRTGIVHGDVTTSNVLFALAPHVLQWSDADLYAWLGEPETEMVRTSDGSAPPPHVPAELVAPIDNYKLTDTSLLQERVILGDFGQSYAISSPPPGYEPGTVFNYISPEARFEGRAGLEADVWALGCAIFEIRAGRPLFESFFGDDTDIMKQTVGMLGRLPDPWWAKFEGREAWFEENGEPKSIEEQERAGVFIKASKSSIRDQLREIGTQDDPPPGDDGRMIERTGVTLPEREVELLGDLLERMLRYRPEERIKMDEVIKHPWFDFAD
ncbi:unnamed protein product [Peniophora sp. CBMAI 1063]|nr:unnamed protein product [Peniophora sp. CBMAI 1063]